MAKFNIPEPQPLRVPQLNLRDPLEQFNTLADQIRKGRALELQEYYQQRDMKERQRQEDERMKLSSAFSEAMTTSPMQVPNLMAPLAGAAPFPMPQMPNVQAPLAPAGQAPAGPELYERVARQVAQMGMGDVAFKLQTQADEMRMKEAQQKEASRDRLLKVAVGNPASARLIGKQLGWSEPEIEMLIEESKEYKKRQTAEKPGEMQKLAIAKKLYGPGITDIYNELTVDQQQEVHNMHQQMFPSDAFVRQDRGFDYRENVMDKATQERERRADEKLQKEEALVAKKASIASKRFADDRFREFRNTWGKYTTQVLPNYKNTLRQAEGAMEDIRQGKGDRARAFATLFGFIKALDNSVVRESEIAAFQGLKNIWARLDALKGKEMRGEAMPERDILDVYNSLKDAYEIAAEEYNDDIDRAVGDVEASTDDPKVLEYAQHFKKTYSRSTGKKKSSGFQLPDVPPAPITGATPQGPLDPRLSMDSLGPLPNATETVLYDESNASGTGRFKSGWGNKK